MVVKCSRRILFRSPVYGRLVFQTVAKAPRFLKGTLKTHVKHQDVLAVVISASVLRGRLLLGQMTTVSF